VIAQGVDAGGHVRGTTPLLELLERVPAAVGCQCSRRAGSSTPTTCEQCSTPARRRPWRGRASCAATSAGRTLQRDRRGPGWIRAARPVTVPLARRLPEGLQDRGTTRQRPGQPFLGPQPPTDDGPDNLLASGPVYAGANVGRISDVRPAAELVTALTP